MKRSSKNYISLMAAIVSGYFLVTGILSASEEHNMARLMNPDTAAPVNAWWYVLIVLSGLVFAGAIAWSFLSRKNRIAFKDLWSKTKERAILLAAPAAGAVLAGCLGYVLIGTLPAISLRFPSFAGSGSANAAKESVARPESESVASDQSVYTSPIPDLPPLKSSDNLITQASGIQTYSDQQTVNGTIVSDQPDVSCILALDKAQLTVDHAVLEKSGDPSVFENALKYGVNAALAAAPGSTVNVLGSTVETAALGATGIAVNGLNASASVTDTNINTTAPNSPAYFAGFQGQMKVNGGTDATTGDGSTIFVVRATSSIQADSVTAQTSGNQAPIVRASGAFTGSALNANTTQSIFAQIEPGGSITMGSSRLSAGAIQSDTGYQSVFIFDNMDRTEKQEPGHLSLSNNQWMINPTSPALASGCSFLIDGVSAQIDLEANQISSVPQVARVQNGKMMLNCTNQALSGPITADESSAMEITLSQGSSLNGAINPDNACPDVILSLDQSSSLVLSGDVYVSEFENADAQNGNITTNGFHIYVQGRQVL